MKIQINQCLHLLSGAANQEIINVTAIDAAYNKDSIETTPNVVYGIM